MPRFAVIRTRGAAWLPGVGLEGQRGWQGHPDFMNQLETEGMLILGGPLDGTPDVVLIMRANNAETIRRRLSEDPWTQMEWLRTVSITP